MMILFKKKMMQEMWKYNNYHYLYLFHKTFTLYLMTWKNLYSKSELKNHSEQENEYIRIKS